MQHSLFCPKEYEYLSNYKETIKAELTVKRSLRLGNYIQNA